VATRVDGGNDTEWRPVKSVINAPPLA
jgi:hypothetical protein